MADEQYMLSLADSMWNGYFKTRVAESIAPCVKRKKMTVTTPPNITTGFIGVKEAFSDTEAMIPFVSTIGNVEVGTTVWVEWTYSASNMIAVSAGTGDTYVVETVQNSEGWKNIVTEVTEASGSAGALRMILSNEEQTVFTNENGSGGRYANCYTTAFVYYGTQNVSSYVTYGYVASSGITGTWNDATRTYSVSAMSTPTGEVSITATYTNGDGVTLSATKVFSIKKAPTGSSTRIYYISPQWLVLNATDSVTQYKYIVTDTITSGRYYFTIDGIKYWFNFSSTAQSGDYFIMDLSTKRVRRYVPGSSGYDNIVLNNTTGTLSNAKYLSFVELTSSRTYDHPTVTFNAYYKTGAAGTQYAFSGRFIIEETQNGSSWRQTYASTRNESARTYTPTKTAMIIRCSLYASDGTTLLDRQTVSVLTTATLSYVRSVIEQQADQIVLAVSEINSLGDTVASNTASIDVQSRKIALVVSENAGNSVVNTASIVSSINNSGSTISMNADKINFKTGNFAITNQYGQRTFSVDAYGNTTFGGTLSAATGTYSGALQAATGTFAGSLSAASGTFNGELVAASGTFTGNLTAATTNFTTLKAENLLYGYSTVIDSSGVSVMLNGSSIQIGYVAGYNDLSITPGPYVVIGQNTGYGNVGVGETFWNQVKTYYIAYYVENHLSSLRYKQNVESITDSLCDIDMFRPVTYQLKGQKDDRRYLGFIAEELYNVCPYAVNLNENGDPDGVSYGNLVSVAIYEIQKLRKRVKELEVKTA